MSRKLLAFLLSELAVVRIKCENCQTVIETTIDRLAKSGAAPMSCPGCERLLPPAKKSASDTHNPLAVFANCVQRIQQYQEQFQVEFVLPDNGEQR